MRVSRLFRYPVKGMRRVEVTEAEVLDTGLRGDREFMVVAPDGRMVTQREEPALATLDPLSLPPVVDPQDGPEREVHHFRMSLRGLDQGDEVAGTIGKHLGREVRLVRFPADQVRATSRGDGRTMFADGYPVLVVNAASLDALNERLGDAAVPVERFRPNVVVEGAEAWAEDDWSWLDAGAVRLDLVKWCDRCVVTTVDQDTGVKGRQPLRELGRFRLRTLVDGDRAIVFGQNAVPRSLGTLTVGAEVTAG